jgi:hypothetical protein
LAHRDGGVPLAGGLLRLTINPKRSVVVTHGAECDG